MKIIVESCDENTFERCDDAVHSYGLSRITEVPVTAGDSN